MDFLLTEKTAPKDISALASFARALFFMTEPFPFVRCATDIIAPGELMLSKTVRKMFSRKTAGAAMICFMANSAVTGAVETAFFNATVQYVALKRGCVEYGKPDGEHSAYKQRVLGMLGRLPNANLIVADREMERAFEREVTKYNPKCSDALLARYQSTHASELE